MRWKNGEKFPKLKEIFGQQPSAKKRSDMGLLFIYVLSSTFVVASLGFALEPNTNVGQLLGRALFAGATVGLLLYAGDNRAAKPKKK